MLELLVRIEQSLERFSLEKIVGRLHLLAWLAVLAGSVVTGWIAYYDRLPSLVVAILAGIGALTFLTLAASTLSKLMKAYPKAFCLAAPFSKAVTKLYSLTRRSYYTGAISSFDATPSEKLQHLAT